jgi:hypothetical protein
MVCDYREQARSATNSIAFSDRLEHIGLRGLERFNGLFAVAAHVTAMLCQRSFHGDNRSSGAVICLVEIRVAAEHVLRDSAADKGNGESGSDDIFFGEHNFSDSIFERGVLYRRCTSKAACSNTL